MNTFETVVGILEELAPGVDFETCETLIDERYVDSLAMLALVADLEDAFEIEIPAVEIVASNFNSARAIAQMVDRIKEEELG